MPRILQQYEPAAPRFVLPLVCTTDPKQQARLWMETVDPTETGAIRLHLPRGYAHGSNRFRQAIELQLGRLAGPAKIGRPKKPKSAL